MTTPNALDSFLDKWRSRWPEWSLAEVFVAQPDRARTIAWFSLLQEFDDILNVGGDPLPADAKLAWWATELRDWAGRRSRHPLGRLLEPVPAPWAALADALPLLVAARARPVDGEAALATLSAYAEAVAAVEAQVLGGNRPAPRALAAQVLATRLADIDALALPQRYEHGTGEGADAGEDARRAWAQDLLGHWPAQAGAARARRMYAGFARHRLQRLAATGTAQAGIPRTGPGALGALWRTWRAASGGS